MGGIQGRSWRGPASATGWVVQRTEPWAKKSLGREAAGTHGGQRQQGAQQLGESGRQKCTHERSLSSLDICSAQLWHRSHKHSLLLLQLSPRYKTCHQDSINRQQDSFAFQSEQIFRFSLSLDPLLFPALNKGCGSRWTNAKSLEFSWYPAVLSGAGQVVQEKTTGFEAIRAQVQS